MGCLQSYSISRQLDTDWETEDIFSPDFIIESGGKRRHGFLKEEGRPNTR